MLMCMPFADIWKSQVSVAVTRSGWNSGQVMKKIRRADIIIVSDPTDCGIFFMYSKVTVSRN